MGRALRVLLLLVVAKNFGLAEANNLQVSLVVEQQIAHLNVAVHDVRFV